MIQNGRLMLWRKAQRQEGGSNEHPSRHSSCCLDHAGVGKGTPDSRREDTSSGGSPRQWQNGQEGAKVSPQEGSGGGCRVPAPCDAV